MNAATSPFGDQSAAGRARPTVSIALATYNGADYLSEQLGSFLTQTVSPTELVVCDDGSTDRTLEILDGFARAAPFQVLVHRNERRLGYGHNFAKALGLCRGDIIFLSDQDDVWYPEKIASILKIAAENPTAQVILNDAALTDGRLSPTGATKISQLRAAGLGLDSFIQGSCAAIRGPFLRLALPLPASCEAHDSWIVELARFLGAKLVVERDLQFYRIHSSNTSVFYANRTSAHPFLAKIFTKLSGAERAKLMKGFGKEFEFLEHLSTRLRTASRGALPPGLTRDAIEHALMRAAAKANATRRRVDLLSRSRRRRMLLASRLLRDGSYEKHFNGLQSLVRDLLS